MRTRSGEQPAQARRIVVPKGVHGPVPAVRRPIVTAYALWLRERSLDPGNAAQAIRRLRESLPSRFLPPGRAPSGRKCDWSGRRRVYRGEGLDGLDPRSRAPLTSPQAVTDRIRDRVVQLRQTLTAAATDAGPVTIAWHLRQEGLIAPSTSTIRRILHAAGWPRSNTADTAGAARFSIAVLTFLRETSRDGWELRYSAASRLGASEAASAIASSA